MSAYSKIFPKLQSLGIYGAGIAVFLLFGFLDPIFLTLGNLKQIAIAASVNAFIGIGVTFVIITGGIDLSVGSIASLAGIISATLMVNSGVPGVVALVVGLLAGFFAGSVNGLLITTLRLPPFIATLGTMSMYQGFAYLITDGQPVYNLPDSFVSIFNGEFFGVPYVVIILLVVAVLAWLLLRRTIFGQNVIATGGSEETAWLSGVKVSYVKILTYSIAGLLAGVGGLVLAARISAAQPQAGYPFLLTAIAAAVIGGADLMGGQGRIWGTLVGALILGAITNGLTLLNVSTFYEQVVTGAVVLVAVAIDQRSTMLKP